MDGYNNVISEWSVFLDRVDRSTHVPPEHTLRYSQRTPSVRKGDTLQGVQLLNDQSRANIEEISSAHSWDKCKSLYVVDTVVVLLSGEKNIVINNTRMKTEQG